MQLPRIVVGVVVVGMRAHGNVHLLAVARERNVTRPMTTTAEPSATGKLSNYLLLAARLQVAIAIRKTHHRIRVADVYPLRIRTRWIKRNPKRLLQAGGKDLSLLRFAIFGYSTKY